MKKLINTPDTLVREMCTGLVSAHPELEFLSKYKIIKKKDIDQNKVTLISGGGSGHEPAHAGFVGKGMLDAAVCGDVFASPSQIQVYQAIKESVSSKGTLLIIKNYTGDVMNFQNAAHLAKEDGINVDYIIVDDDIAVEDSLYTVGKRGVAGTVLVHKTAGAAALLGYSLDEVKQAALKAVSNVRSIGFALSSCTVPAKGSPTFELGENEIEYGVGIHGEPGIKREKLVLADELAAKMVHQILKDMKLDENSDKEIALLINGFGATPLQELYIFNNCVRKILSKTKIKVFANFTGNYMTSIDMAGASISIMKLDSELKNLISQECITPGFNVLNFVPSPQYKDMSYIPVSKKTPSYKAETDQKYSKIQNSAITANNIIYMIDKMSECIIKNEVPFCELDSHAGDGDFGMSVARGFKALKQEWHEILEREAENTGSFLRACSLIIMENCGGASGPIWGSAFRAAGKYAADKKEMSLKEFASMIDAAVKGIQKTGERSFGRGAEIGDKTLIDALIPCAKSLEKSADENTDIVKALQNAAKAAVLGAEKTNEISAKMGRAGAVGERSIGFPDAGAYALGVIFTEIAESLK